MSKREAFLKSCCTENVDDFLRFIQLHRNKTEPFDVEEVLQEMNRDQRQTLWGKLSSLLQDVLQEERREEGSEERREEAMEVEAAADPSHVRSVVDGVTLVAAESLKVLQDGETYSSLLEIIHRLHDLLELQPVSEAPLQLQILRLCDAWWKKDLKEKETFGRSAMIIALTKSFDLKKPGTEIQRVWSLREVLLGLDYTSEDNKQMMDLLLKCFQRPAFLRNDDVSSLSVPVSSVLCLWA
ncbi:condensin-2 complex subunit G2-like [Gymnodraco acuticeps]|uniref:Condensin-2 complex subunit G2-like n=1 Tax=Gymnodraco acuticeps TaxID=8218 RepID=A0A6P8WDP9_GYMAC|nr:condensin-2 complex subunit G2-like [Gymnodraco acuticeps]